MTPRGREHWLDYLDQYLDYRYGISIEDVNISEANEFFDEGKTPEEFAQYWGDDMGLDTMQDFMLNEEPFKYKPKHDGTIFDPGSDDPDQGSLFDQLG